MHFEYEPTLQLGPDTTEYRSLGTEGVSTVTVDGKEYLKVDRRVLKKIAKEALYEINYFFRKAHLRQLANELNDPEASDNDKFVIYTHLQNAVVAAHGLLYLGQLAAPRLRGEVSQNGAPGRRLNLCESL